MRVQEVLPGAIRVAQEVLPGAVRVAQEVKPGAVRVAQEVLPGAADFSALWFCSTLRRVRVRGVRGV